MIRDDTCSDASHALPRRNGPQGSVDDRLRPTLLCGTYVDRRIAAIQIVQILSPLDGRTPTSTGPLAALGGACGAPTGPSARPMSSART